MQDYTACETHTGIFEVKNNIALTVTLCIASFEAISELQRKKRLLIQCYIQHLVGMDEHMDNFCKQRTECLCHYIVIVCAVQRA